MRVKGGIAGFNGLVHLGRAYNALVVQLEQRLFNPHGRGVKIPPRAPDYAVCFTASRRTANSRSGSRFRSDGVCKSTRPGPSRGANKGKTALITVSMECENPPHGTRSMITITYVSRLGQHRWDFRYPGVARRFLAGLRLRRDVREVRIVA
jgi:hypothetical protein